jgi:hypothetical protein
MDYSKLVRAVRSSLDQGDYLEQGVGNLVGAQIVCDLHVPSRSFVVKRGNWFPNQKNPPLSEGANYHSGKRRIIAFQKPDFVLLLEAERWFGEDTHPKLLTLDDYKKIHENFMQEIGSYGFIRSGEKIESVLQELVNREVKIFEEITGKY